MTKSQVFRKDLSLNCITDFFKQNLSYNKEQNLYISDMSSFKKMIMFNKLLEFKSYITPFYYDSKINYPMNITNIRGFHVVLRQICKELQFKYEYKIQYFHSKYEIVYYIHIPDNT